MKILSWNVNGIRACAKNGFLDVLESTGANVVALQEVRAFPEQIPDAVREPQGWHGLFAPAERPGYSGVAFYSRSPPQRVQTGLGVAEYDVEGRVLTVGFGRLSLVCVYVPKGSGKDRDNSRVPYKLGFQAALFEHMQRLRRYGPTLVMGDINTAHEAIDLARPKGNVKSSGFLPEERAVLDDWLAAGWVDTFRSRHEGEAGHYTWWRQFGGARAANVGWRIDYVFASPSADALVRDAFILPEVLGSDHCPVGVDLAD